MVSRLILNLRHAGSVREIRMESSRQPDGRWTYEVYDGRPETEVDNISDLFTARRSAVASNASLNAAKVNFERYQRKAVYKQSTFEASRKVAIFERVKSAKVVAKQLPKNEEFVDENGVRTTIEYAFNEEGKIVKTTRRTKRTLQKSVVDHAVAERQKWAKFGLEKNNKPGPDRATTTVGENVVLKLSAGNKHAETEQAPEEAMKNKVKAAGAGKVSCRLCKGDHFTAKCPYKDTLGGLENTDTGAGPDDDTGAGPDISAPAAVGGKYVPPSMRGAAGGARGPGESMRGAGGNRDDLPTLRVTNISEDTQENDLRELFGVFGRVARVYVGRDRETGAGKGFAFVSFEDKANAQKAIDKVHGRGYDNLILSVQWSQPRPDGR
ncbi:Eukaryotic translation initiation factor 3 subunit G [Psilocybe cubensis]|uniref:Eukaryotic translation initiation factor 3 subunit G n=1 Tax=Psilocybe cubensis TaxID=181762 RepID=A0ACB8GSN5_PSICU|nr:Eukaryotic translation initiation factor 3 subunit G [Psilocybe cubensis]KAH9478039.1 Eukaryotic translation initiation factor 3 subunit G [Psilocybe cubensis]